MRAFHPCNNQARFCADCASATASASDSVQRARADRLAKHKQRVQRDLEATQALAVEQRRKADQVIGDLPFLAAVCKDIGVQAPAAIELLRAGQKLGAGSYGQARFHLSAVEHRKFLCLCPRSCVLVGLRTPNTAPAQPLNSLNSISVVHIGNSHLVALTCRS